MLCIVLVDELYYCMYYLVVKVKYFLAIDFYDFLCLAGGTLNKNITVDYNNFL